MREPINPFEPAKPVPMQSEQVSSESLSDRLPIWDALGLAGTASLFSLLLLKGVEAVMLDYSLLPRLSAPGATFAGNAFTLILISEVFGNVVGSFYGGQRMQWYVSHIPLIVIASLLLVMDYVLALQGVQTAISFGCAMLIGGCFCTIPIYALPHFVTRSLLVIACGMIVSGLL